MVKFYNKLDLCALIIHVGIKFDSPTDRQTVGTK